MLERIHPSAGICLMCNKSHHGHKAGGKVSPRLFWPWGRRDVGGLQGQNHTPPHCGWMLKAQGSWDVSPAAISHLLQRFVLPLGDPALGDMWLTPSSSAGGQWGRGRPSACPQARGDGKPQPRAQSAGTGVTEGWYRGWYGGCWEWVWRLLRAGPGGAGLLQPCRAAAGPWLWVSLGWLWWKKRCLKRSPALPRSEPAAGQLGRSGVSLAQFILAQPWATCSSCSPMQISLSHPKQP